MKIDVLTIYPGMFPGPLDESIVKRARESGRLQLGVRDLRDYTHDRHRTVDDRPFGGGPGMLMKPEPLFEAVEDLRGEKTRVILTSPAGRPFRQEIARQLPGDKIVIRKIGSEGLDHPIPPRPMKPLWIPVHPLGISVTSDIQPLQRHSFRIVNRGQVAIHQSLISIGAGVRYEGLHLGHLRRQPPQIKTQSSNQCLTRRLRRGNQSFGPEFPLDKPVNGVAADPVRIGLWKTSRRHRR